MKEYAIRLLLCLAAAVVFMVLGIIAGPGVIIALVIQGWLEWEDRYRCQCSDQGTSPFAVVGFLVLWVPWVFYLCVLFDEATCYYAYGWFR